MCVAAVEACCSLQQLQLACSSDCYDGSLHDVCVCVAAWLAAACSSLFLCCNYDAACCSCNSAASDTALDMLCVLKEMNLVAAGSSCSSVAIVTAMTAAYR